MLKQHVKSSFRALLKRIKGLIIICAFTYLEPDTEKHSSACIQHRASDETLSQQLPSPDAGYSLLQLFSVWTCKTQDNYWEPSACISPSSHPSPDRPLPRASSSCGRSPSTPTQSSQPTLIQNPPGECPSFHARAQKQGRELARGRLVHKSPIWFSTHFTSLPTWAPMQSRREHFEVRPWVLAALTSLLHLKHHPSATALSPDKQNAACKSTGTRTASCLPQV